MPPQVVSCEPGWPVLQGFEQRLHSLHVLHSGAFWAHAAGAARASHAPTTAARGDDSQPRRPEMRRIRNRRPKSLTVTPPPLLAGHVAYDTRESVARVPYGARSFERAICKA